MAQKFIKCTDVKCPKFFVDSIAEREKATHNGWNLNVKGMGTCGKHQYQLFAEVGVR